MYLVACLKRMWCGFCDSRSVIATEYRVSAFRAALNAWCVLLWMVQLLLLLLRWMVGRSRSLINRVLNLVHSTFRSMDLVSLCSRHTCVLCVCRIEAVPVLFAAFRMMKKHWKIIVLTWNKNARRRLVHTQYTAAPRVRETRAIHTTLEQIVYKPNVTHDK